MTGANIGNAYVQIVPKAEGISSKIGSLIGGDAKNAGKNAGQDAGNGFGSSLMKVLGGLAIGATVTAGFKAALDEGGKLQQSYGGLETIYGDAAEAAKKYAKEAAQAGISANDYAENAVSFGASLKQAFEGDTAKAVEAANTAILDMTDNAAKMGTPIENIQNAYQGFAKGNYTMLDNLKLGYGGTKEEMQRLLTDAEKLTGVKYDMSNLGDVYAAIHAIQGDLGLTGVAAAEASETFSGSFEAMKASAANLLGALALGEDVTPMMSTFIKSIGTFVFGNLIPMIGTVVKSLPAALSSAISTGLPILQKEAPKMLNTIVRGIQTNLPKLIAMGLKLLTSIQQGITSNLPTLMTTAANIITSVGAWITANLPIIIDKGKLLLFNMIDGIMGALPQLATAASNIITSIANFLAANLPTIGEKGGQMLQVLATKIISSIPQVIAAAAKIAVAISKALIKIAPIALKAAVSMIKSLVSGIKNGAASCLSAAKGLVDAKIMPPLKGLVAKVKTVFNNVKNAMVNTWNTIKSRATTLWNSIKTAITSPIESAKNTVSGVISTIKGFFPISIGKIMSNIQLPHFSVSGGQAPWGFGGQGSLPSVKLTWNAKAMQNPYLFSDATLFGAGEAGDEVLYGRANLMRDIRDAVGSSGGNTYNINITVDGAEAPEDYARRLARQLQLEMRMA